jgi:hypothetical protein
MLDYGYADFDVRHRFIGSLIYPIPFKMENNVAQKVLGGWNISTIVDIESGSPFTIWDVTNFNVTSTYRLQNGGAINYNGLRVQNGNPNSFDYIVITGAPCCATDPLGNNETGPYPNSMTRRNAFRGPGYWNADVSLFKNLSITERYKLQFRGDVFNLFNHANTFLDTGNAYVFAGDGVVNASKNGKRTAQVSLRFSF